MENGTITEHSKKKDCWSDIPENWKIVAMIIVLLLAIFAVIWLIANGVKYPVNAGPMLPQDVCRVPINASCGG